MLRTMLKSTIQRATVTSSDAAGTVETAAGAAESGESGLGSVTIDEDLLDAADLLPGEQVSVVDKNGARLQSYVIAGERGSGVLAVAGPAARPVAAGELVAVLSYAAMDDGAARAHRPKLVRVDGANRPLAPAATMDVATDGGANATDGAPAAPHEASGAQPPGTPAETDDAARLDALIQVEA